MKPLTLSSIEARIREPMSEAELDAILPSLLVVTLTPSTRRLGLSGRQAKVLVHLAASSPEVRQRILDAGGPSDLARAGDPAVDLDVLAYIVADKLPLEFSV